MGLTKWALYITTNFGILSGICAKFRCFEQCSGMERLGEFWVWMCRDIWHRKGRQCLKQFKITPRSHNKGLTKKAAKHFSELLYLLRIWQKKEGISGSKWVKERGCSSLLSPAGTNSHSQEQVLSESLNPKNLLKVSMLGYFTWYSKESMVNWNWNFNPKLKSNISVKPFYLWTYLQSIYFRWH